MNSNMFNHIIFVVAFFIAGGAHIRFRPKFGPLEGKYMKNFKIGIHFCEFWQYVYPNFLYSLLHSYRKGKKMAFRLYEFEYVCSG